MVHFCFVQIYSLSHMAATHPHSIMLYQLSLMVALTKKNVLGFLTTSKTGPNAQPQCFFSKHKPCFHIKKASI